MGTRDDILAVTSELLARQGVAGTSTRAVCDAAGVTAPTLYHHFGDKQGLLDAVVEAGYARYLAGKRAAVLAGGDPVENLRRGWDAHVAFGLAHPSFYAVMFGRTGDGAGALQPTPPAPAAAREAWRLLLELLAAVERAGRLRMELGLAAQVVASAAHGVTSLLLAWPSGSWDERLSVTLREAMIAAVVAAPPRPPTDDPMARKAQR